MTSKKYQFYFAENSNNRFSCAKKAAAISLIIFYQCNFQNHLNMITLVFDSVYQRKWYVVTAVYKNDHSIDLFHIVLVLNGNRQLHNAKTSECMSNEHFGKQ